MGRAYRPIQLKINPAAPNFPTSIPIATGAQSSSFKYTFQNQCIISGDPQNPGSMLSPSATSPYQTYAVTATIQSNDAQPCADWEVTAPLKLQNRVIQFGLVSGEPGDAPVYNPAAGAQLNADPAHSPEGVPNSAQVKYFFPYPPGSSPVTEAPVTVYLFNDKRQPQKNSVVRIQFNTGASAYLSTPARLTVPIPAETNSGTFTIEWLSKGPAVNYSNLFFLVIDAGCPFGQAEFWLSVWNWS